MTEIRNRSRRLRDENTTRRPRASATSDTGDGAVAVRRAFGTAFSCEEMRVGEESEGKIHFVYFPSGTSRSRGTEGVALAMGGLIIIEVSFPPDTLPLLSDNCKWRPFIPARAADQSRG